jgi:hypothetical protein
MLTLPFKQNDHEPDACNHTDDNRTDLYKQPQRTVFGHRETKPE